MKAEIKQIWIAALTSGEYQQSRNALRKEDGFCCLGVLCDIHAKATNTQWRFNKDEAVWYYQHEGGIPGCDVLEWAGLDNYKDQDEIGLLIRSNDKGKPFVEIAAHIEELM